MPEEDEEVGPDQAEDPDFPQDLDDVVTLPDGTTLGKELAEMLPFLEPFPEPDQDDGPGFPEEPPDPDGPEDGVG